MKQTFKAELVAHGPGGAWTYLHVPFNVAEAFGTRARVPVAGSINGYPFRNSLMPNGDGTHSMMVSKALRAGARAGAGDAVRVIMDVDRRKRTVRIPRELAAALRSDTQVAAIYKSLAPSHRKEFAEWVGSAKQEATRLSRAAKALALIRKRAHAR